MKIDFSPHRQLVSQHLERNWIYPKAGEKPARGTRNNKKNIIQEFITSIARRRKKKHSESISHTTWGSSQSGPMWWKNIHNFFYVGTFIFVFFPYFALPGWCDESFPSLFLKFNSHLWFCYWICGELNNGKVSLSCVWRCGCIRVKIGWLNRADLFSYDTKIGGKSLLGWINARSTHQSFFQAHRSQRELTFQLDSHYYPILPWFLA